MKETQNSLCSLLYVLLILEAKKKKYLVYTKTLKSTQIVMKIFIKNNRNVAYFTISFLYHDNDKLISQVKNIKHKL